MELTKNIKEHYQKNWGKYSEHKSEEFDELPKEFRVLKFKPNKKRDMWTYATCGMSARLDNYLKELHIFSAKENDFLIELLAAIAHYHHSGAELHWGHTVNFGCAWAENSNCRYGLISLPYLDGEDVEVLYVGEVLINFWWLIPITKEELEYKKKKGLDALEEVFEKKGLNYVDVLRKSVVK